LAFSLGFEKGKMTFSPKHRPRFVSGKVRGHTKEPGSRVVSFVAEGPNEDFLSQVSSSLHIPNLSVKEPDQLLEATSVDFPPVNTHLATLSPSRKAKGSWLESPEESPQGPDVPPYPMGVGSGPFYSG